MTCGSQAKHCIKRAERAEQPGKHSKLNYKLAKTKGFALSLANHRVARTQPQQSIKQQDHQTQMQINADNVAAISASNVPEYSNTSTNQTKSTAAAMSSCMPENTETKTAAISASVSAQCSAATTAAKLRNPKRQRCSRGQTQLDCVRRALILSVIYMVSEQLQSENFRVCYRKIYEEGKIQPEDIVSCTKDEVEYFEEYMTNFLSLKVTKSHNKDYGCGIWTIIWGNGETFDLKGCTFLNPGMIYLTYENGTIVDAETCGTNLCNGPLVSDHSKERKYFGKPSYKDSKPEFRPIHYSFDEIQGEMEWLGAINFEEEVDLQNIPMQHPEFQADMSERNHDWMYHHIHENVPHFPTVRCSMIKPMRRGQLRFYTLYDFESDYWVKHYSKYLPRYIT